MNKKKRTKQHKKATRRRTRKKRQGTLYFPSPACRVVPQKSLVNIKKSFKAQIPISFLLPLRAFQCCEGNCFRSSSLPFPICRVFAHPCGRSPAEPPQLTDTFSPDAFFITSQHEPHLGFRSLFSFHVKGVSYHESQSFSPDVRDRIRDHRRQRKN